MYTRVRAHLNKPARGRVQGVTDLCVSVVGRDGYLIGSLAMGEYATRVFIYM